MGHIRYDCLLMCLMSKSPVTLNPYAFYGFGLYVAWRHFRNATLFRKVLNATRNRFAKSLRTNECEHLFLLLRYTERMKKTNQPNQYRFPYRYLCDAKYLWLCVCVWVCEINGSILHLYYSIWGFWTLKVWKMELKWKTYLISKLVLTKCDYY